MIAEDRGIPVKDGYPIDMAHLFHAWFLWGFWDKIFQVTIFALFATIFACCKSKDDHKLQIIVFCALQAIACLSTEIWFVSGLFWRFSRGGRVASGDKLEKSTGTSDEQWPQDVEKAMRADGYQINSGKAMAELLYIVIIAISAFVLICSLFMIISCCCGSKCPDPSKGAADDSSSTDNQEGEPHNNEENHEPDN